MRLILIKSFLKLSLIVIMNFSGINKQVLQLECTFPALLVNYDKQTDLSTDQSTDQPSVGSSPLKKYLKCLYFVYSSVTSLRDGGKVSTAGR